MSLACRGVSRCGCLWFLVFQLYCCALLGVPSAIDSLSVLGFLLHSFFRGDWSGALYQDRYTAMTEDIGAALSSEDSVKHIMSTVDHAVVVRACWG